MWQVITKIPDATLIAPVLKQTITRKQQDGRTCRRTRSRQGWRDDARVEPALPPTYRDRGLDSRRPPGAGEARGDTGNRKQQRPKHLTI